MPSDIYDEARLEFKKWTSHNSNLIPIEFGDVGVKGVSDLDLGVVIKNKFSIKNHLDKFPELTKKIMNGGTLMIFPDFAFKNINFIDDVKISFLNNKINLKKLSIEERYIVNIIQVIEWLPERILCIYKDMGNGFENPKRSLAYLYSLCYTLKKILFLSNSKNSEINNFILEVCNLRNKWNYIDANDQTNSLISLVQKALSLLNTAINLYLGVGLVKKISNLIQDSETINFNLHSNVYIKSISSSVFSINKDERLKKITINVPHIFMHTYIKYSKQSNSRLSQLISKRINKTKDTVDVFQNEPLFNNILQKRFSFMHECFEHIILLNLNSGLYKFGWYL